MADTKYAVKSGFYDSVNHDRLYSADDMNQPYKSMLSAGIIEGGFAVTPQSTPDMTVIVAAGHALLGDKWVDAAAKTLTVPENTALYGRIDAVVLRVDINTGVRAADLIYRTGTPASEPEAPALIGTTGIYEVRLANITVAAGATAIAAAQISDQRGTSGCPYVTMTVGNTQIQAAVEDVLEAHPEWTTTVEDGSITLAKLASGVIDNTLTQAGAAADAKTTGDALTALNNDLSDKDILANVSLTSGYISADGTIHSDSIAKYTTDLLLLKKGYYLFEHTRILIGTYNIRIIEYTSEDSYVEQFAWFQNNTTARTLNEFYVPSDMYVRVSIGGYTNGVTKLYNIDSGDGTSCDLLARQLAKSNMNLINPKGIRKGYTINSSGEITETLVGSYTDFIPCISGEQYTISALRQYSSGSATSNIRLHGFNSKKEWVEQLAVISISDNTQEVKSQTITVPSGCEFLAISNGWNDYISVKLEYGDVATSYYDYEPVTPNKNLLDLQKREIKDSESIIQLYRGTISNSGVNVINDSVKTSVFTFMMVVQKGETVYVDIPNFSSKYFYNVYLYDEKYVFNKKANGWFLDPSNKIYITGPCLYRVGIIAKNGETISDAEFAELSSGIKINTIVLPIVDKRPKYALIGNPDIYKAPDIDYLVTSSMSASYIYDMYDALVELFPNNITKETLGTAFNLPIYCYTFQPTVPKTWHHYGEQWNPTVWGSDPKLPMILIVSGTHGDEKGTVYGLAKYMTQMWSDDATAETNFIRDNAVVKVVPILNVSGFADNTRNNRNNVNLNRDFGAFTQTESRLIKNLYEDNKDYIRVMVDFHQTPTRPSFWADPKDDITQNVIRTLAMPLGNYWESQKPELKEYSPRFEFWYFDVRGAQSSWFSSQGVISTTCESTWNITGMEGTPVWGTNDLFAEKCGIDLLGNTLIQFLKAVPNFVQSYFERLETLEIIEQPTNQTVESGDIAEFTVSVVGYSPTYQWQYCADDSRNFINVENGYVYPSEENPYYPTGGQSNSNIWPNLRVVADSSKNGYWYRCVVYDQFGNIRSSKEVQLFVN